MRNIEETINDLLMVEKEMGDPRYNSGMTLFAGKTAENARLLLENLKAVEPVEIVRNKVYECGYCGADLERDDKYCHECRKKIKWHHYISDY